MKRKIICPLLLIGVIAGMSLGAVSGMDNSGNPPDSALCEADSVSVVDNSKKYTLKSPETPPEKQAERMHYTSDAEKSNTVEDMFNALSGY